MKLNYLKLETSQFTFFHRKIRFKKCISNIEFKIKADMKIHTFRDSHSYHAWKNILPKGINKLLYKLRKFLNSKEFIDIKTHHLGPILCYSFGRDVFSKCDISLEKYKVHDGDIVVFAFGEIDCRCHINKYVSNTYIPLIDQIIENYLIAIKNNIQKCNANLHSVCIYNVPPPASTKIARENPDYPFLGDDETRKSYHKYFNQKLSERSKEYNYKFIDVYYQYTNREGYLSEKFSDGNV